MCETPSRFSTDGGTARRGRVDGQLAVDSSVEFGVAVQSKHQPTTALHQRHAASPEPLPAVLRRVVAVRVAATDAVMVLCRWTRVVYNYIFIIFIIIIVVVVVVVFVVDLRVADVVAAVLSLPAGSAAAAAQERSERVADLAADVRVRQIQTDVDQRSQLVDAPGPLAGPFLQTLVQQREHEDRRRVGDQRRLLPTGRQQITSAADFAPEYGLLRVKTSK